MKYYVETRYYYRRSANSMWREATEERINKHEISEHAYNVLTNIILEGIKPIKNKDGSVSYPRQNNYNELIEDIITVTEA